MESDTKSGFNKLQLLLMLSLGIISTYKYTYVCKACLLKIMVITAREKNPSFGEALCLALDSLFKYGNASIIPWTPMPEGE